MKQSSKGPTRFPNATFPPENLYKALWRQGLLRDFTMVTLPKTNSSHLKMDGWKMKSPFGARPIWSGELLVSGSVYIYIYMYMAPSHHQDYYIFSRNSL